MKKTLLSLFGILLLQNTLCAQNRDKEIDELKKNMTIVKAENEGWNKAGILNIGINQALLENWAAGGERLSLAINGQFNGSLTRTIGNKMWNNTLDMFYGLNYIESNHFIPRKLDDRIDFSSRFGWQPKKWTIAKNRIKKFTYLTTLLRFQSQFTKGFNYSEPNWASNPISEFLSPGYFTFALGAEYKPNDNFSIFFSPLAAKVTVVKPKYTLNNSAYGVLQGKTARMELGAYLTTRYRTNITKNILYSTRLDLYSNYLAKNHTDNYGVLKKDNPGNIDILWDNFIAIKISKFIGAGIGFTMIYDNDIPGQKNKKDNNGLPTYGPLGWIQLKQVMNVGFSYKF